MALLHCCPAARSESAYGAATGARRVHKLRTWCTSMQECLPGNQLRDHGRYLHRTGLCCMRRWHHKGPCQCHVCRSLSLRQCHTARPVSSYCSDSYSHQLHCWSASQCVPKQLLCRWHIIHLRYHWHQHKYQWFDW